VLADFIEEGHFARHIRRMRVLYGELRRVLVNRITQDVGSMVEVVGDEAGMHLAVMLRNGHRDVEVAKRAVGQNLSLWPLSPSYLGEARQGLILGFGATTMKEIPSAVRKLCNLLATK
jgi:GntR family transcriptional regulator/MocR family aminotransferase